MKKSISNAPNATPRTLSAFLAPQTTVWEADPENRKAPAPRQEPVPVDPAPLMTSLDRPDTPLLNLPLTIAAF